LAEEPGGSVVAIGILVSMDDDAEFSSSGVVAHALAKVADARVGAVATPFKSIIVQTSYNVPPPDQVDNGKVFERAMSRAALARMTCHLAVIENSGSIRVIARRPI
jgi:hypothetical protein